jgi:hypothetical protein
MERWPALRDPEYGLKLERLRERLAGNPSSRPVVIVLGSSRVSFGLRFERLTANPWPAKDETAGIVKENVCNAPPLAYNFGLSGFTPSEQLMCLRRLLADGIHPDLVLVEFTPVLIGRDQYSFDSFDVNRLRWQDVRQMVHKVPRQSDLYRRWFRAQLVPWYYHRYLLLNHLAPDWLEPGNRMDLVWEGLDAFGWVKAPFLRDHREEEAHRREAEVSRPYFEHLGVPGRVNLAFRDLVVTCHENKIGVALLLTPEASRIRSLYTAQSLKSRNDYLRRFAQQNGCGVIDATAWVPDDEFVEGCHTTHAGAITFTKRFQQEVLRPLARTGPALIADRVDVPAAEPASPIVANVPGSKDRPTR